MKSMWFSSLSNQKEDSMNLDDKQEGGMGDGASVDYRHVMKQFETLNLLDIDEVRSSFFPCDVGRGNQEEKSMRRNDVDNHLGEQSSNDIAVVEMFFELMKSNKELDWDIVVEWVMKSFGEREEMKWLVKSILEWDQNNKLEKQMIKEEENFSCPMKVQPQWAQQQPSTSHDKKQVRETGPEENLKFLMKKVLCQSDVDSLGRIVLPNKEAEAYLPNLEGREHGIIIAMEDAVSAQIWNMHYRIWPNNENRIYLLENAGEFVQSNGLEEGDFIEIYYDIKCGKYLIRGVKIGYPERKSEAMEQGKAHGYDHDTISTPSVPSYLVGEEEVLSELIWDGKGVSHLVWNGKDVSKLIWNGHEWTRE